MTALNLDNASGNGAGAPVSNGAGAPVSSCEVTLRLVDSGGRVLQEKVSAIAVGRSAFVDFGVPTGSKMAVRGVLLFGYSGGAPLGPESR